MSTMRIVTPEGSIKEVEKVHLMVEKEKGIEFGRPKLRKPENYEEVMRRVNSHEISTVEAMKLLGVKKTSFYKLKKLYPVE